MFENQRVFKEPNKINFPDDTQVQNKNLSIYELLLQTEGDYKKVSQILDRKIYETNQLIRELTENIKSLADNTFTEKLKKLQSDNMETMLLCDEFRKIASRREREQENFDSKNYRNEKLSEENIKKIYDKPPLPKQKGTLSNSHVRENSSIHYPYHYDVIDDTRSNESYASGDSYKRLQTLWKENEEIDDVEGIKKRETTYKREAAMERLTRSKSSLSRYHDDSDKTYNPFDPDTLVAKWRHKVTVPQPFEMTVREESKKNYKKMLDNNKLRQSRSLTEFQAERAEKERLELEETKKQFKANPVPAHVYIPLYETMQEESNQRRQFIREYNKEILKSIEKPFNFYKRDLEKQKQKAEISNSSAEGKSYKNGIKITSYKSPLKSYHGERQKTILRANEVPKSMNDPMTLEKMKEEELLRLIKAEMRSKQLLEESKMPGNMAERQRIQEEKQKKKLKDSKFSLRTRSKSAESGRNRKSIPDFSRIHREWEEEIRMSYKEPHVTQPKPFNLLTEQRPHNRSTTDIENAPQNNFNFNNDTTKNEWNKSILTALEIAKPSTNKSTMLREMAVKSKIMEEETKIHNKSIEQLARKKREMDVSDKIRKSLDIESLPRGEDKRRQKTKELKVENELRKENYQRELDEIKKKVNEKPLLLEVPVSKQKPITGNNRNNNETHKSGSRKSSHFNGYDERNNFGDPASYRSSTDASCSMDDGHPYKKNDRPKPWNEESEKFQSQQNRNSNSEVY